jgi:hypothetical protein
MEHPCPSCSEVLKSEKAYNKHLAIVHESFPDGTEVKPWTLASLLNKRDQTLFLLLKHPECRAPNNGPLWLFASQYFIKDTLYDQNHKAWTMNAPDGFIGFEQRTHALAQLEDYRRSREALQHRDKHLFHDKDGNMIKEHRCILPSPTQMVLADLSEQEHRRFFSPMRN